ncbi:MAG: hypothetical protein WC485_11990, partial [Opitutaceae bacterium]
LLLEKSCVSRSTVTNRAAMLRFTCPLGLFQAGRLGKGRQAARFFMSTAEILEELPKLVGGHSKCTTFGHLKMHHFMGGKTGSD